MVGLRLCRPSLQLRDLQQAGGFLTGVDQHTPHQESAHTDASNPLTMNRSTLARPAFDWKPTSVDGQPFNDSGDDGYGRTGSFRATTTIRHSRDLGVGALRQVAHRSIPGAAAALGVAKRAFPWTPRERFPSGSTVGADLGERLLAQRFPTVC